MALRSEKVDWYDRSSDVVVDHVEELISTDN